MEAKVTILQQQLDNCRQISRQGLYTYTSQRWQISQTIQADTARYQPIYFLTTESLKPTDPQCQYESTITKYLHYCSAEFPECILTWTLQRNTCNSSDGRNPGAAWLFMCSQKRNSCARKTSRFSSRHSEGSSTGRSQYVKLKRHLASDSSRWMTQ